MERIDELMKEWSDLTYDPSDVRIRFLPCEAAILGSD